MKLSQTFIQNLCVQYKSVTSLHMTMMCIGMKKDMMDLVPTLGKRVVCKKNLIKMKDEYFGLRIELDQEVVSKEPLSEEYVIALEYYRQYLLEKKENELD